MLAAYVVALAAVRTLSTRMIVGAIVALHVILLLGPPLQLTDVFNYLGYARLGGLHELNPYTHVIGQEMHDPIYHVRDLAQPAQPVRGAVHGAQLSAGVVLAAGRLLDRQGRARSLLSLGFIALVWHCARQLGRDPRYARVFVGLNPIYLMYAVGGLPQRLLHARAVDGARSRCCCARRDRSAGAALMLAVAVKFTAVLLLPFLLVARRAPAQRRCDRGRRGARGDPADRDEPGAVRILAAQPVRSEHAADRLQLPEPGRPGDRRRRRRARAAAGGDVVLVVVVVVSVCRRARLAGRRRVGDVRADREPRLAHALVRDLAAAAGGAWRPASACAGPRWR